MKKILSIAGLDSSGGAGIGADIKTITAHKMYAMSAISAITAQNTLGVRAIMQASAQILSEQISACFDDMGVDALKTGMLFNAELVNAVIKTLKKYQAKNIVCDPVMLATSGAKLLQDDAIDALWELFSISDIITPNLNEASFLAKCEIKNLSDMKNVAKALHTRILNKSNGKNCAVLIKGGHLDACDVLFDGKNFNEFKSEKIHTKNTHGTGCTLSSAIACALASGLDLPKSISHAKNFVLNAIKNDINIGKGCGAINHCYNIQTLI